MKIVSVVGARPQFVKLAPIAKAAAEASVEHVIVHTGQHYDPLLSDVFFDDLGIAAPDVHLGVGSGSHGVQTGAMLGALDAVFDEHRPDWVLVYGDTNSTVAAALSAVKLHLPVAHLEAGLRSFNRRMPEEHNRVLTDHAADLLLAPTQVAVDHLAKEEQILFPLIRAGRGPLAGGPIHVMEAEHEDHRENLERTRRLAGNLVAPPEACATWRALCLGLVDLERELMEHIHLENNVLFRRALVS